MKHAALLALGGVLLSSSLTAQAAPTRLLVGGLRTATKVPGGLFHVTPTASSHGWKAVAGSLALEQNPASLALDGADPTVVYVGTYGRRADGRPGPCNILAVRLAGDKIVAARQLNATPMSEDYISAIVEVADHVYYLGRRTIGAVPKKGGAVEPLLELAEWMDPRGLATDGRYLFAAINSYDIVKADLARANRFTAFAQVREFLGEEIQNLAIDNAGDLLVVTSDPTHRARLLLLDHDRGRIQRQLRLPLIGGRAVAQDPETDTIYVVGGKDASNSSAVLTIQDWKVRSAPTISVPNALPTMIVLKPRNIFRRGGSCVAPGGRLARMGSTGRARLRQAGFSLTLASTEARRRAVLLLGIERPGFRAVDLGRFGAPGCLLGVDPLAMNFVTTDAAGAASMRFTAPNRLSVHWFVMNAQWLVHAPGANALGLITSETARIIIRD